MEDKPSLTMDESDQSDLDWSLDDEISDEDVEPTICLFCDDTSPSVDIAIAHLKNAHNLNLAGLKSKFNMDQYSFLKLINCIRSEKIALDKLATAKEVFWSDEKYLKAEKYEPWLSYDFEDLLEEKESGKRSEHNSKELLQALENKVKVQAILLEQAKNDMNIMRKSFQRLVAAGDNDKEIPWKYPSSESLRHVDDNYFNSYSHFSIHQEMLSDVVRTTSYQRAILCNSDFICGKDVLDVGCGTAVLSMFASQAGAKTVVGIDNSDIVYNAMDIVRNNNITNVSLVKGRLEDTSLPQEKFDIIISEWMGYFLFFEGMLDSVIYARENYLKEGGMLLPNRCKLSLLGYGSEDLFHKHIAFWNNVYGLDMSTMRREVMREPLIEVVDKTHILTKADIIADLNLLTVDLNYSDFSHDFSLECTQDGKLSSLVGYFETYFDLPHPVSFGTAPTDPPTHWKQVVFFLEETVVVKTGEFVNGKLTCKRSRKSARSIEISIEVFDRIYEYYLD